PRRGVWASPEEVVVTVGAQHALYMIAELLFADQARVAIENPGYPDARNIFSLKSQRIISVDVDQFGLPITAALEHCDYAYVTPSHQCPTTIKMPEERRLALLQSAEQHDFIVIEDDYEAESSFAENPSPALKSSDRTGRVLYIGSLSKTFAPGLRLGYIVGSPKIIRELRGLRRLMAILLRLFKGHLHYLFLLAISMRWSASRLWCTESEALSSRRPLAGIFRSFMFIQAMGGLRCGCAAPTGSIVASWQARRSL
ncbi:MAG: hypothetical protein RLZZ113_1620, partial [Pseudomonadota bacterium]